MKAILLFLLSCTIYAGPSNQFMTEKEQLSFIEDLAKSIRRSYWVRSHDFVESRNEYFNKSKLDSYYNENDTYESQLTANEYSQLYRCVHSQSCELYRIEVHSSYMAGSGVTSHFVLLYTKSQKKYIIDHTLWAE